MLASVRGGPEAQVPEELGVRRERLTREVQVLLRLRERVAGVRERLRLLLGHLLARRDLRAPEQKA